MTDGARLYTMYVVPKKGGKAGDEVTVALDAATGKTLWEEAIPVELLPKQESFGQAPMQPQATPTLHNGRVFTIGFTGALYARDAANGKLLWSVDLVKDHAATPVQFGFSASPILHEGRLIVPVGGKHAVVAFDPKDGKVLWKTGTAEPAYATPVILTWDGRPFVVQLTRDAIFGYDPTNGETAWTYSLPKKGLTNVPTPIPLSDGRLLVSGQGFEGTMMLQLTRGGGSIEVKQLWHQRKVQFFYTNWAVAGNTVYGFPGNMGKRFMAVRLTDGSVSWQDLSQTDANVLCLGNKLLLCRGDGLLSLGSVDQEGFEAATRAKPVSGRCWSPPTAFGGFLVVRSDSELATIKLSSLVAGFKAPADSGVSALDAAFGGPPKPKSPDKK